MYVSCYEYTEATATFWRFLGRIENFLDNSFFFFSCETCFYYVVEVLHEKKHTLREFVLILFNKSRFTFDLLTKDILAFSLQKGDENQKFQVSF